MSHSLLLGCLWVFASVGVAMLPVRRQFVPAGALLALSVPLILFIGIQHGALVGFAAALALVSMFRNPLRYLWARMRGQNPSLPE